MEQCHYRVKLYYFSALTQLGKICKTSFYGGVMLTIYASVFGNALCSIIAYLVCSKQYCKLMLVFVTNEVYF